MNKGAKHQNRPYRSPLRERQAAETGERILEAVLGHMRAGRTDFSVPEVARSAGCSVPTVYRHFPTRDDLLTAIHEYISEQVPLPPAPDPSQPPAEHVRTFFEREAARHRMVGTDLDTEEIWEFRQKVTVPRRRKDMAAVIEQWAPELGEPERSWLEDILVVLISSTTAKGFRRYLGLGPEETAKRVAWAVEALRARAVEHARNGGDDDAGA